MKSLLFPVLLLTIAACSFDKKETASNGGTTPATDSLTIEKKAPETIVTPDVVVKPQRNNFHPEREEPLTKDGVEVATSQALAEILTQYDTGTYRKIRKEYTMYIESPKSDTWEYQTWYFDSQNNLRAYERKREEKVGYDYRATVVYSISAIYFFSTSQDSVATLVGVYSDEKRSEIKTFSSKKRMLTSKVKERIVADNCPQCGVNLMLDFDPRTEYKVTVIDQKRISGLSETFFKEYNDVLKWLKNNELTYGNFNNRTAKEELTDGSNPYTVNYSVDSQLYENFIKETNPQ